MSAFVPIRARSGFQAGVVPGSQPAAKEAAETPDQVTEGAEGEGVGQIEAALPADEEALKELLQAAFAEGREAAEQVLADTRAEVEAERDRLVVLRDTIEASRAKWSEDVRSVLGEVVMVGVRSVISESATLQEELLQDRFAEIGERLIGEQSVIVHVRPEDEDAARALVGDRPGWKVVPEPDLSGGVVAETEGGKVDASLGSALAGLADSVQDWQGEGMGEE